MQTNIMGISEGAFKDHHFIGGKTYLLDFSRTDLVNFVREMGIEKYRSDQLFKGIYSQLLNDFSQLTTISKDLRSILDTNSTLRTFSLIKTTQSPKDKTTKFLWQLHDGKTIESVIIYEGKRVTFCISSQVGCALDCKFCATGKMGFVRNLSIGEIVEQVIRMMLLSETPPSNIVYMGMGEPLLNLKNVLKASYIIADPEGMAFSRKKITISTSGVTPGIRRMAELDAPFSLAVSLNAVRDDVRRTIMPISIKYPLEELYSSIDFYVKKTGKRITFEYVLLGGINDSKVDADALIKFTSRFPCKINLIPCNTESTGYPPPSRQVVHWFQEYVHSNQRTVTTRLRKGWEIQAACGQLYSAFNNEQGSKIRFDRHVMKK